MKLCTFEVATRLGRHSRLGAVKDGRIVDLNFAVAWYMAQQGEFEPQRLADGLVPPDLPLFLRTGLRASHTAEELFLGAGPHPADWWRLDPLPHGPNGETLAYRPGEVRLCAPLPGFVASGEELGCPGTFQPAIAAVTGRRRTDVIRGHDPLQSIAGYTIRNDTSGYRAMGPYLATAVRDPYNLAVAVRVNGREALRTTTAQLSRRFEERVESALPPGEIVSAAFGWSQAVAPGDAIEIEIEGLGVLANRVNSGSPSTLSSAPGADA